MSKRKVPPTDGNGNLVELPDAETLKALKWHGLTDGNGNPIDKKVERTLRSANVTDGNGNYAIVGVPQPGNVGENKPADVSKNEGVVGGKGR